MGSVFSLTGLQKYLIVLIQHEVYHTGKHCVHPQLLLNLVAGKNLPYKGSPSAGTEPNLVEVEDNPVEVEDNPVEVEDTEDNNGGRYIRDNGYDAKAAACRRLQLIGIELGHFIPSWWRRRSC